MFFYNFVLPDTPHSPVVLNNRECRDVLMVFHKLSKIIYRLFWKMITGILYMKN